MNPIKMWQQLSIKVKLITLFVFLGLGPLILTSAILVHQFTTSTEEIAGSEVKVIAEAKASAIQDYLGAEAKALHDLADHPSTQKALQEFTAAFYQMAGEAQDPELKKKMKDSLTDFYKKAFAKIYKEKSGQEFDVESLVKAVDGAMLVAQYDYISNNPNPIGKKNDLERANRESKYHALHGEYHPYFRRLVDRHAWYDFFLMDTKGRLVYSVFKETDFGTSLTEGVWKDTGIARAFRAALKLKAGEVAVDDFATYSPSYEAPASFVSRPVFVNGNLIGVAMFQIPLDKITAVASDRRGLGEKGEVILVGADGRLRADTHRNKETHNVAASFAKGSKVELQSEALSYALAGKSGEVRGVSYDGLQTLAYAMPLEVMGLKWYLVTELAEEELFATHSQVVLYLIIIVAVLSIIVVGVGLTFSSSITNVLRQFATTLETLSVQVLGASNSLASSSQELSAASTEQAASLQETAASLNEISSMVEKSADRARMMASGSSESLRRAAEGKATVSNLLVSMREIDSSNEAILEQVKASNDRMNEILEVIQNIGAKTKVINEIVFQTKPLSFNASVEAARAGEHGKGFAVVAEEVGNLATMSGNAAQDISNLLGSSIAKVQAITQETGSSVERLVVRGKDKVKEGGQVAEQTAQVLETIIEGLHKNHALAEEVSTASGEQSDGVAEINKAIGQLDAATHQTAAVGQAASNAALQLSQSSAELKQVVDDLLFAVEGRTLNQESDRNQVGSEEGGSEEFDEVA